MLLSLGNSNISINQSKRFDCFEECAEKLGFLAWVWPYLKAAFVLCTKLLFRSLGFIECSRSEFEHS